MCGAETATQKVSSGFCYAHAFCGIKRCGTLGIPQSGLPPVGGGIPAMPLTFRRNVWEREPPPDRRDGGGGGIPSEAQSFSLAHTDRKIDPSLRRNPGAAQEVSRTQGGAFFFTKKAYCVNQTLCVAGARKSCTDLTPPLFPPLKRMGFQRGAPTMRRQRRILGAS